MGSCSSQVKAVFRTPESPESGLKAILFDCDGVLVDTEKHKQEAWTGALKALGSDVTYGMREYRDHVGLPAMDIAQKLAALCDPALKITADQLVEKKDAIYHGSKTITELGGMHLLLHVLSKRPAIKTAIVSSGSTIEVADNVFMVDKSGKVMAAHADGELIVQANKPGLPGIDKTQHYKKAMERLGVQPSECGVIEDTQAGVDAARRAGIYHVWVMSNSYGYTTTVSATHYLTEPLLRSQRDVSAALRLMSVWHEEFRAPQEYHHSSMEPVENKVQGVVSERWIETVDEEGVTRFIEDKERLNTS